MKMSLLLTVLSICMSYGLLYAVRPEHAKLINLPPEMQMMIVEKLVVPNDLQQSIKNIGNFAQTNTFFHDLINNPQNMRALLKLLGESFIGETEGSIAYKLNKMPGITDEETKQWLKDKETQLMENFGLFLAVSQQNLQLIKKMVAEGTNINTIMPQYGINVLHQAIRGGSSPEFFTELIKLGANANHIDKYGNTPLLQALIEGTQGNGRYLAYVEELLKHNPDLTIRNKDGKNAMDIIKEKNDMRLIKLFADYKMRQAKK